MSRIVVDTNVLVYAIDQESRFYERSQRLLSNENLSLVTTSKNLIEFLCVVTKSSGYNLDTEIALSLLQEITAGIEVVYPSHYSVTILVRIIREHNPKGIKIHDFEIISISLSHGFNVFASFNQKDFSTVSEIELFDL